MQASQNDMHNTDGFISLLKQLHSDIGHFFH